MIRLEVEILNNLVRDLTAVGSISKSEARERIIKFAKAYRSELVLDTSWEDSVAIKGGMEMMPSYMRECLIPFISSLLHSQQERLVEKLEGMKNNPPPFPVEKGKANEAMRWGAQYAYHLALTEVLASLETEKDLSAVLESTDKQVGRAVKRLGGDMKHIMNIKLKNWQWEVYCAGCADSPHSVMGYFPFWHFLGAWQAYRKW